MSGSREVVVTSAVVHTAAGEIAARIDLVKVGGGTQVRTVDGAPEEVTHDLWEVYHVRFISPDPLIPDELREVDGFADACKVASAYADRRDQHAEQVSALAETLKG